VKREAPLQDEIKRILEDVIKGRRFHGIEFSKVERDWPVDGGREADIALLMLGDRPFLLVETKRKEARRESGLVGTLERSIVGQVESYAALYQRHRGIHVPFVATATPERIAVFAVPKDIPSWVEWEAVMKRRYSEALPEHRFRQLLEGHLVRRGRNYRSPDFAYYLLNDLTREQVSRIEFTDALLESFREFVDRVAERVEPRLEDKLKRDRLFGEEIEKLGYKLDRDSLPSTLSNLSRMMAYVLLNKLVFYKVLEQSYRLPNMAYLDTTSWTRFNEDLRGYFSEAMRRTRDFEPIFSVGVYDEIPLPDDPELMEYINGFISLLGSLDLWKISDRIGYMYEELIPPEERHQLGQFYTPSWVCELITKWCIRGPDDVILDPGVGSGGFLLKAYDELVRAKLGTIPLMRISKEVHGRILNQLYALDLNPFPAHLTSVAVSMKHIEHPSTNLNIVPMDFFECMPEHSTLSPYKIRDPLTGRAQEREVSFPRVDAVVGNPPYTRWTEIPEPTQDRIRKILGGLMKRYGLTPQVSRGVEPGIYTYWILHATNFLREGGRLGMIISNTWLQTDYGIGFANFLLDHFRIRAIIDFAAKLFEDALITTCIVLAEREMDETKRLENEVAFVHIPGEIESADVDGLLEAIEIGSSEKYDVRLVKQRDLPRDRKWIDMFFKTVDISEHSLMTKLGELFEPLRGNTAWAEWALSHGRRPDPGSSEFHYLSPSKIREHGLDKWAYPKAPLEDALVYPAITSARQTNFFTFTEEDWKMMCGSDDRCYMFVCHKPRKKLPKEVANYIKWGETECRAKGKGRQMGGRGRLANKTEAAKARAKERRFYGWYDLGGVISVPIFAIYRAWRKTRFVWCRFPVAMFHGLIALVPKKIPLDEIRAKALLAYLNSNFAQSYIETKGLKTPGGIIELEVSIAREMPILDVRKLNDKQLGLLAELFDELEQQAREIGGASEREQIRKLKPKIYEIDRAVAEILGLTDEDIKKVEAQVDLMVERRVSVAKRAL